MADYKGQGEKLPEGMKKEITRVRENQEAVEETDLQRMARENMDRIFGVDKSLNEKMEAAFEKYDADRGKIGEEIPAVAFDVTATEAAGSPFKQPLPPWPEAPEVAASEPQGEAGGHPYKTRADWSPPPQADAIGEGFDWSEIYEKCENANEAGVILDDAIGKDFDWSEIESAMKKGKSRGQFCDEAKHIITKERNGAYGEPEDSFASIAENWTWWLKTRGKIKEGEAVTGYDVAQMMVGFKQARGAFRPDYEDGPKDQIGYSAIAGELGACCPPPRHAGKKEG